MNVEQLLDARPCTWEYLVLLCAWGQQATGRPGKTARQCVKLEMHTVSLIGKGRLPSPFAGRHGIRSTVQEGTETTVTCATVKSSPMSTCKQARSRRRSRLLFLHANSCNPSLAPCWPDQRSHEELFGASSRDALCPIGCQAPKGKRDQLCARTRGVDFDQPSGPLNVQF